MASKPVIADVLTSGCVRASATDALRRGFRPVVVAAPCGGRTPTVHNANLFDPNAKYGDVTTTKSAVAQLGSGR
jgi:maleamate amidohydrolase